MAARLTRKFISVGQDQIYTTSGGMPMWRPASRLPFVSDGEIADGLRRFGWRKESYSDQRVEAASLIS
jgi:hypothetical protein